MSIHMYKADAQNFIKLEGLHQRRLAEVDLWSSRSLNEWYSHVRNRGAQIEKSGIFSLAV